MFIIFPVILESEWELDCGLHLHMWAIVQIIFQFSMIVIKSYLLYFVNYRVPDTENATRFDLIILGITKFSNRLINFFWLSWWLVGIVLRFGKSECSASSLLTIILIQFIIQWSIFGLILLALGCAAGLFATFYLCYPHLLTSSSIQGAPLSMIRKLHEEIYDPNTSKIKTDDTVCAICLNNYQATDKILYLPCKHHFHSECIEKWLLTNKSCPFCKRLIDQDDEAKTLNENSNTNDRSLLIPQQDPLNNV